LLLDFIALNIPDIEEQIRTGKIHHNDKLGSSSQLSKIIQEDESPNKRVHLQHSEPRFGAMAKCHQPATSRHTKVNYLGVKAVVQLMLLLLGFFMYPR
jgi:hypothetical protein